MKVSKIIGYVSKAKKVPSVKNRTGSVDGELSGHTSLPSQPESPIEAHKVISGVAAVQKVPPPHGDPAPIGPVTYDPNKKPIPPTGGAVATLQKPSNLGFSPMKPKDRTCG